MSGATQGFLGLTDGELSTSPRRTEVETFSKLRDEPVFGLALDAPRELDLGQREQLQVVLVRTCSFRENVRRDLQRLAMIVVTDLDTHRVRCAPAFEAKESTSPPEPPVPLESIPSGIAQALHPLDLGARGLSVEPGTLQVQVLLHDEASNATRTRVFRHKVEDPAVAEFLARRRRVPFPAPVMPPPGVEGALPDYRRRDESPEVPSEVGIALTLERVVLMEPGARAVLRGSFRLPVLPGEVVRPRPADDAAAAGWQDVGDPEARAVVPITLLITDLQARTREYRLRVPVHEPVPPAGGEATGHFHLDLFALPDPVTVPSTYAVWAVGGGVLGGPALMGLVTPDMLPTR